MFLRKKKVLENLLYSNMSLCTGDNPLKGLFLPAIIVASLGTFGHIVLRSTLRSSRSRSKSERKVNPTLNPPSFIMLLGQSGNTPKGLLPHAVTVARMATPRLTASS
jgi:hypothetical protein